MGNERIKATDSMMDILTKMSDGNPGGLTVCMQILQNGTKIDPDSALGGFGAILEFDTFNIWGSRIWGLYKDVCKEDLPKTLAMLRACQLGFLSPKDLNFAIDNYGKGIDVKTLYSQVKERLPAFNSIAK